MQSKIPIYIAVILLFVIGFASIILRSSTYGVPIFPGKTRDVWNVEAKIQFTATGGPVHVSLAAPATQKGYTLIEESSSSPGYSVSTIQTDNGNRIEWNIRDAKGKQTIYYKTRFLVDANAKYLNKPPTESITPPQLLPATEAAATTLINQAYERSSNTISFTRELIKKLSDKNDQNVALILNTTNKIEAIAQLLSSANVINRTIGVVSLADGRRKQHIDPMIDVWTGEQWVLFDPESPNETEHPSLLEWDKSNISLLDLSGGTNSQVTFSIISEKISPSTATNLKVISDDLLNFSIQSLPTEEQAMFKTIMMIPIGALIVVFLRIIVGLKTSGTFMPVLIALAFVQTQLIPGIVGFLVIVGVGLLIRSYLSKLNLLLVARISILIISVILMIAGLSVVAFKMGITQGLAIAFYPMIILSWTIERMSILWEEQGSKQVFIQGGGSLLTASIVYLAMTNPVVEHITFNFIGVQFIILGIILLLGTYTGYRLSELKRFKPLAEKK